MSILNLVPMPPTSRSRTAAQAGEPAFVSRQVTEASRFYLNLNPSPQADCVVVCGGVERTESNYQVQRKTFPFCCVEFVAEGRGTVVLNQRKFPLRSGVAFAYAPGVAHSIAADTRWPMRKYYLDFAGSSARKLLASSALGRWQAVEISSPLEVASIFDAIQREAAAGTPQARDVCDAWLRVLLLKLREEARPVGQAEPRAFATFDRIRQHVEANFLHLRTVEDIARGCHVTPMHVSRLFRRFAQTGAYQFLLRRKMTHAAGLLLDRGMLVKEVADALGFADAFHFSRLFKRIHGLSPSQFVLRQR